MSEEQKTDAGNGAQPTSDKPQGKKTEAKTNTPTASDVSRKHRRLIAVAAVASSVVTIGSVFASHNSNDFPTVVNGCWKYGNGTASNEKGRENELKNRWEAPEESQIDFTISLDNLLTLKPTSDKEEAAKAFDEDQTAAQISGYVLDVVEGGKESCNCSTDDPAFKDTHIYIAKAMTAKKSEAVIVEVTPRFRILKAKFGLDWSTKTLKTLKGKYVQITGWLFFDGEHWPSSQDNTAHKGNIWRATCWEVHPVTDIQEIAAPAP